MFRLYRLVYLEPKNAHTTREVLTLLYPDVDIPMMSAAGYLVIGYVYNHLTEFHRFIEGIKPHG